MAVCDYQTSQPIVVVTIDEDPSNLTVYDLKQMIFKKCKFDFLIWSKPLLHNDAFAMLFFIF